jgi:hypothetical protein
MKTLFSTYKVIKYLIAIVWLVNGLYCKVLNLVPRHQLIVARILGPDHAGFFTRLIGISEIFMAIWILSSIKPRFCALVQIAVVGAMNLIEYFLAPDLLLFGKLNAFFAFLFMTLIYCNEFVIAKKTA